MSGCLRFLAVAGLAAVGVGALASAPAPARHSGPSADRRVVVLAVPGLTWKDLDSPVLPNLRALLDGSAVGNLATRVTNVVAEPGEAYLTLGTGTRAVAPDEVAGLAFQGDEPFGVGTAADEYARQHGGSTDADVVALGWPLLVAGNDGAEFGGAIGALGEALADAGVDRGVVANADGANPLLPGEQVHREAALALADGSGATPCGRVSAELLVADAAAPFGVRLSRRAVLNAVDVCSTPGSVVLVEASDLRRAVAFGPTATEELADAARQVALAATDELVAAIVDRLDRERDAIVVVAPSTMPDPGLGVVGIRSAEHPPGLLTSGNTRRPGYLVLTDLTPTIARLAGVEMDEGAIEGRTAEARGSSRSGADRRDELIAGEAAGLFRDRMLGSVVLVVTLAVGALALAAGVVFARGWTASLPWLARAALVLLVFPSLTYLAALLRFQDWGATAYWAFLGLGSLILGLAMSAMKGHWLRQLTFGYGLLVAVVTLSVVGLGSRLQMATVFGDSPIVAGRFTGINNVTFGFFVLAGSMLACIAIDRVPGERGRRLMLGIVGAVLLIDVAPMWGADVGGALAGLPALVLLATGLGGWKVRWRIVAIVGVGTVLLVAGLAWLDLSRASADRSHLGRLFERIGSEGVSGFTTVVERKLTVNLRSLSESPWRYLFGPLAIAAGLVAWRGRERVHAALETFRPLRSALPGLAALAVLGYGANDSGIAVPAAMLALAIPGFVYLACRVELGPEVEEL